MIWFVEALQGGAAPGLVNELSWYALQFKRLLLAWIGVTQIIAFEVGRRCLLSRFPERVSEDKFNIIGQIVK